MTAEFVDTNILVYAHDRTAGEKREKAASLLKRLWDERSGCTSVQVLQEFVVTASRELEYPLAPDRVRVIIEDMGVWPIHSPAASDVLHAIAISERFRISFWDGMILHSTRAMGASVLWSEDLKSGGLVGGVRIRNPFTE